MNRSILLFVLLFSVSFNISAQKELSEAEQTTAESFAIDFLSKKDTSLLHGNDFRMTVEHIDNHIVVLGSRNLKCGIILVRPNYRCNDFDRVLAYSTESTIRPNSNSMKGLLSYYETITAKAIYKDSVNFHTSKKSIAATGKMNVVAPMLKDYDLKQFDYKEDIDGKTYIRKAGCGIVRIIQLMMYYNYPTAIPKYKCQRGHGSKMAAIIPHDSLIHLDRFMREEVIRVDNHSDGEREVPSRRIADIEALTPLAKCIGVATDSEYHQGWTMTYYDGTQHALTEHLGFSNMSEYVHNATVGDFYTRVSGDIRKSHPVLISGGGHGFICDGIDNEYLHMNYGWGGANNGWYRFPDKYEKLGKGFLRSFSLGVIPRKSH